MDRRPHLIPLASCAGLPGARVGRKAAVLGWAAANAMVTPGGLVLAAEAFWAALDACGAAGRARYLQASAVRLDPVQAHAVAAGIADAMRSPAVDGLARTAADEAFGALDAQPLGALNAQPLGALNAQPLVCRSSAAMEDGPAAAFPGVFVSVLGIGSPAELAAAVATCWRSAFSPGALAYVLRMGVEPIDLSLALLLQRQVEARWYGVYAGVDPVTGVAEPVADLTDAGPDALVAGGRPTIEARRRRGRWSGAPGLEASLESVHGMAGVLAGHLGAEVDIEFALAAAGAEPVLLQCRPLTAIGRRGVPASSPAGEALAGRPCAAGRAAGVGNALGGIAVVDRLTTADAAVVLGHAGVVTEHDASPLGHVAILCRELGVALICGVADAQARLDGRWVEIDGATGAIAAGDPRPPAKPGPAPPPAKPGPAPPPAKPGPAPPPAK
ncbi:MAG: PEP/pyruvate-binding domain-containing protein, partial [Acidimicrobiales bacterium]